MLVGRFLYPVVLLRKATSIECVLGDLISHFIGQVQCRKGDFGRSCSKCLGKFSGHTTTSTEGVGGCGMEATTWT